MTALVALTAAAPLVGEIIVPGDGVDVHVALNMFRQGGEPLCVPVGSTLAEIVRLAEARYEEEARSTERATGKREGFPRPALIVVTVGDQPVKPEWWSRIRVKRGTFVSVRGVPGKDGGLLRNILLLALAVAAPFLGGALARVIGITGAFGKALISGAVLGAGSLAVNAGINALFPVRPPSLEARKTSQTYSITGGSNTADPFGVVPFHLGANRYYPKLGARSYTEHAGGDTFFRMLFVWGYGPLDISALKIGETPLARFDEVEVETHENFVSGVDTIALFPREAIEEPLSIALTAAGGWQTRTTAAEIDEITVDVTAPAGIYRIVRASGERVLNRVDVTAQYRKVGEPNWRALGEPIVINSRGENEIRRWRRRVVANGQYQVRLSKTTADYVGEDIVAEKVYWTALRCFRKNPPLAFPKPVAVTALRIKATGQLNGIVEAFNGVVRPRHAVFDGEDWGDNGISKNPADLGRYVLQGAMNARPRSDAQIDLERIEDFWRYCDLNGFEFNQVRDFKAGVWDCLADIFAAGRAFPCIRDGRFSVRWDEPDAPFSFLFTPRNSRGFTGSRDYVRPPHAFRVRFVNQAKGWKEDERIVYDDGYDAGNATEFVGLQFPGITTSDLAWRHGRFHIAQARLRPGTYSLVVAREHFANTVGDRGRVQHPLPLWGLESGRVKSVAGQTVTVDEPVTMVAGNTYGIRFRAADGEQLVRLCEFNDGVNATLTLVGDGEVPAAGDLFAFGKSGLETVAVRIKKITPLDEAEARLTLVADAPEISTADQGAIPEFVSPITLPPDPVDLAPVNLAFSETTAASGEIVTFGVIFSWETVAGSGIVSFETEARDDGGDGDFRASGTVDAPAKSIAISKMAAGTWTLRVRGLLADGTPTAWATLAGVVISALATPADVTGFRVSIRDNSAYAAWDAVTTRGFRHYVLRWSPLTEGAEWSAATVVADRVEALGAVLPALRGTLFVKGVNLAGVESVSAAAWISDIDLAGFNVIESYDAQPDWDGTLTAVEVVSDDLRLTAAGGVLDWGPILDISANHWTTQFPQDVGTFEPDDLIDLGEVFTSRVTVSIEAFGDNIHNLVGSWGLIGLVGLIGGDNAEGWRVVAMESHTLDDPDASPEWSEWAELQVGDYTFRAIRFRLELYSLTADVRPVVTAFSVTIDMPDRHIAGDQVAIASNPTHIAFDPPFRLFAGMGTAHRLAAGVRLKITDAGPEGFDVTALNDADAFVSGQVFSYTATGAGRLSAP